MNRYFLMLCAAATLMSSQALSQPDSTFHVKAITSITNNGFAIIPAFSLGKPACALELVMGNKRFSFEPQFRFSLHGKPWIFNFIYRYKLIQRARNNFTVGANIPSLNFVSGTSSNTGIIREVLIVKRFLAGELIANHIINTHITTGLYLRKGHAFQPDGPQNTNYLAWTTNITKIEVNRKMRLDVNPQLYYVKVDHDQGFYLNIAASLGMQNMPVSISGVINKALKSNIQARDFDWNVSLLYTLQRKFVANHEHTNKL